MGSPARRLTNPITRCREPTPFSYAGTDDGRGTDPNPLKLWPPPAAQPDDAWPDRWYAGVLDAGDLPLPPGLRKFGQHWP
jgi:hypothetical protein